MIPFYPLDYKVGAAEDKGLVYKLLQLLWKATRHYLRQLNIHIPCDTANPLSKYYREILKYEYQVYSLQRKQTKQKTKLIETSINRE